MDLTLSTRFRRTISSLSLVLSAWLFTLALAPAVASAHAEVVSSNPANGATVAPGMTSLSIVFSEEISPDQSTAQLMSGGSMMSNATAAVDRAERTKMNITTPALQPGQYTIKWTAVTVDDNGHTNGEISFTVSGSGSTSPASGSAGGSDTTSGSSSPSSSLPATGVGDSPLLSILALMLGGLCLGGGYVLRRKVA